LVEEYIEHNERARAEVDELRETAAALALMPSGEGSAPAELWDRIAADIAPTDELRARREKKPRHWVAPVLAVAAAVIAIVLTVQVVSLDGRLGDARDDQGNVAIAFDRALEADGARTTELVSADTNTPVGRIVVLPDGTGYMKSDDMAALSDDETYQLWALVGNETDRRVISAGVLGNDPGAAGFRIDGPVEGFAVTIEQAGGVEESANDPIAIGSLA
ncbi:MAG TPA: anti-sigma factor, partial [Acidimicrobiia bacterium]|nr:anti-sigma factor [Acidimicrobiia bacterium]